MIAHNHIKELEIPWTRPISLAILELSKMHIGVDTGGTFTDIVAFDPVSGKLITRKVSSTPENPAVAVLQGLQNILEQTGTSPKTVDHLVHGTTVVTNAVLQGKWARTALITTAGFRDVLEIGRQNRPELYNFFVQKPEPLISRDLRFEVSERLDYRGKVLRPLDETAVMALAGKLQRTQVDSVAVVLLFSYLNPAHELRVREILTESLQLPIVLSCETSPEFREYERTATTALNAALVPIIDHYLQALERQTIELGIEKPWRIMQSNAGLTNTELARKMPVTLLLSGPAGGVEGARFVGAQTGFSNLITLDMGGTSCDVSLIHDGQSKLSGEGQIAGRPLRVPLVDMQTIGAGGGSIAWLDAGGALRVGPQSAGADPGPACYGRGGTAPTITDAQLLLGRLNPSTPLGDIPALDLGKAQVAMQTQIAKPLGMTLERAAAGVLVVADAHMERAIRLISVERGHDPRNFALLAFGGAGPLHAGALARHLDVPTVLVPHSAGVLSAFGLLSADVTHAFVQTAIQKAETLDWKQIHIIFRAFRLEAQRRLRVDGIGSEQMRFTPSLDVRYQGQSFELNVPVLDHTLREQDFGRIASDFHQIHRRRYGHADPGEPVEIVNLRLTAVGPLEKPAFHKQTPAKRSPAPAHHRAVYFEETGWIKTCPCYVRESLQNSMALRGPAILEGAESTVVIDPDQRLKVDPYGHLIIERL